MNPESVLRTVVLESPAVTAMIGARFTPEPLPQQSVLPACTYQRVSQRIPDEIPFPTVRIQVTCWAATRNAARDLAEAVKKAVRLTGEGWKGQRHGMAIKYMKPENDLDLIHPDTGRHTVPIDFKVTYRRT